MTPDRRAQVERWYTLTRDTLPSLATRHRWPIRLDHCFMRVCLDAVIGAPWSNFIGRPAIRTMSDAQLTAAIGVAERIAAEPSLLPELDETSLRARRAARLSAA